MVRPLTVIGIDSGEIRWIRALVALLRHPDPSVPELARQALLFLADAAAKRAEPDPDPDLLNSCSDKSEFVNLNTACKKAW